MLIFFGTSGDLPYPRRSAEENRFDAEGVAQGRLIRDDRQVDYFTFRMTPRR
ncbi:hypothetical protein FHR81_001719 [Actinoalloteichus hoggarensis]|uniref:Uncharacterized protein n=1 Tax=Actinoalloteichus hoggarensis TaxID=1470176 RepID=A0A221W514_9PSEU|nr:hypothetical protein [Actinoalloteichus hoggarensis]ASO20751.1 hypothetical protein AHOG_15625 [Actinoalloteichus hoggarensis]MBB5920681.1 hypothetical protein [Actinoalloteichus hoggarensis]